MDQIRACKDEDLAAVAALYQRVWGPPGSRPAPALVDRLRAVLFDSPWRDETLPSLVYDEGGSITGFVGVLPRPMMLDGRTVPVAVVHSLMVDPASRNRLAGVSLLREVFSGAQALTLTDAANAYARRVWKGLGGAEVAVSSLGWIRPLRPARWLAREVVARRPRWWPFTAALAPVGRIADAIAARVPPNRFERAAAGLASVEASVEELLESIQALSARKALRPVYDVDSLRWLLDLARCKEERGPLCARLVRDPAGAPLGHYLCYVRPGGTARVLQLAAAEGAIHPVLARLFRDTWAAGAIAVSGQVTPDHVAELLQAHCLYSCCCWVLVHSREPMLVERVLRGDAFLTRLDGDWWMSMLEAARGISA